MGRTLPLPYEMRGAGYRPTSTFLRCLGLELAQLKEEVLVRIDLDRELRVLGLEHVAEGCAAEVPIKVSAVYRGALFASAANIVLVHNHPSGHEEPSVRDVELTGRFKLIGELMRVYLYDHLIVAKDDVYSFRSSRQVLP